MAGQFQAPVTPSLTDLARQALDGDTDAAFLLARRSMTCQSFTEFLDRYVPDPEIIRAFDVFCDAWWKAQQETFRATLDTLELPAVEGGNLNADWTGS